MGQGSVELVKGAELGDGLTEYILRGSFEDDVDGNPVPITAFTISLDQPVAHQVWFESFGTTVKTLAQDQINMYEQYDSHVLLDSDVLLDAELLENNDQTNSGLVDEAGVLVGYGELRVAAGIKPEGDPQPEMDLYRLVLPNDGTEVAVSYSIANKSGTNGVEGVTVVPEPMTMSLLGLGGLAVLRRRRKA
jgi:hypothetical protein